MKLHDIFTVTGIIGAAVWFTLCDKFFHIDHNILVYHWQPLNVLFQGQSAWTFPIFLCATTGFFFATRPFANAWRDNPSYIILAANALVCTLAYFGSGMMGNAHPVIYFWIVLAIWVARILFTHENRNTAIKACLIMGFLGCFWEGATSKLGYFDYHYTNIFNIPLWLFACYLHAGFLMLDLQSFRELFKRSGK
ncbi:MAG TPA: DUF2878 family protein [Smithella sp.]|nr:DUF2878 family protein [Smithella sp.]MDM7988149.1 DUF2878 family protein [Smithella sp.]HNY51513.1 DUF2878 family protein [Smithella sp.]HOG90671.1 DUF2878 family protein [Smithella sp.]HOU51597.1 DUF2878 family protein [Smithella sp.]